jgi:hypothetical protein
LPIIAGHARNQIFLDSCNENLPSFGILEICACSSVAAGAAPDARVWATRGRRPARPPVLFLLCACSLPVVLVPPPRFLVYFPSVAVRLPVFPVIYRDGELDYCRRCIRLFMAIPANLDEIELL